MPLKSLSKNNLAFNIKAITAESTINPSAMPDQPCCPGQTEDIAIVIAAAVNPSQETFVTSENLPLAKYICWAIILETKKGAPNANLGKNVLISAVTAGL